LISLTFFALAALIWYAAADLTFRLSSSLLTTSWYFQPTSCDKRPTVQNFRPGRNLKTRRACGTTIRLTLSNGGGMPSKTLSLSSAAIPRAVLWGICPRMALYRIREGARKWNGPRVGLYRHAFRRYARYLSLFRKNSPEMLMSSHRTTTIFCPFRSCLATVEASRPRR